MQNLCELVGKNNANPRCQATLKQPQSPVSSSDIRLRQAPN
jgi:hypothetical protein